MHDRSYRQGVASSSRSERAPDDDAAHLPDWTQLPLELIRAVAAKLGNIFDHARFRGVCSAWRSAASPFDPRQSPWLLLPFHPSAAAARSFLDPASLRVVTADLPDTAHRWLFGSAHGWLIGLGPQTDSAAVSLLNPFTRAQIHLPPLPAILSPFTTKAALTSNPASSPAIVAIWRYKRLYFYRLGDENWTMIDLGFSYLNGDFNYHEEKFYVVNKCGSGKVVDARTLDISDLSPPVKCYLVESSGELLLAGAGGVVHNPRELLQVFKLVRRGEEVKWSRVVGGISGRTLFLSEKQSVSVRSGKDVGCRGDCIYFAAEVFKEWMPGVARVASINVQDMISRSDAEEGDYWQASQENWTNWRYMNGITWVTPSLN
ncbi:putative F-box/kelch-repeat protein [Cocos nucifera]|uniref:Putative F-box/kelch-repeat protein n=1 Tax=Cocos nucifera TaxID=13894 RepID=A0A8K0ILI5_COCNU|nr:putative F-box/kelch-repeat protein [Cocos nucifera]